MITICVYLKLGDGVCITLFAVCSYVITSFVCNVPWIITLTLKLIHCFRRLENDRKFCNLARLYINSDILPSNTLQYNQ